MDYNKPIRNFEKFGPVSPKRSYHVRLENVTNMDKQDMATMVDLGRYFSIFSRDKAAKPRFSRIFAAILRKIPCMSRYG